MDRPLLAALIFDESMAPDPMIAAVLARHPGLRVAGLLQSPAREGDCDCRDLTVRDLQTGAVHAITQNLGAMSRGCRLDGGALAELAGGLLRALQSGPDLLILNRFGKSEAEGGGLRQVLEEALARGIPTLAPVNPRHLALWRDYAGDLAEDLPCDAGALENWISRALRPAKICP
ncbi:DUF2478 domain-containing protein [Falsigemmobacter faecalis]|uniref:DUF2478 domain-containing protein n=1 Tax=Falsigemmobacter faecalis TaxID=2488730 RepID=A0A3P3DZD4_9RHOB|nr:DUF2478 domain-containing protein [Falsigemmobacter faecalis]RRH78218.1 DUF2478 domain-containing protein [Falsigemmobacter faecalis]